MRLILACSAFIGFMVQFHAENNKTALRAYMEWHGGLDIYEHKKGLSLYKRTAVFKFGTGVLEKPDLLFVCHNAFKNVVRLAS